MVEVLYFTVFFGVLIIFMLFIFLIKALEFDLQ